LQYVLSAVERQNLLAPIAPAVFLSLAEDSVRRVPFDGVVAVGRAVTPIDQDERLDDQAERDLLQRTDIGPTEVERLSKARRGQGVFRDNVCRIEKACRVTGVTDPSLLIASHIKPWRDSSDAEKLDGYNGLMLAPHVDRLFDRGYISFEDDGEVLVSSVLDPQVLSAWGLQVPLNVGEFDPRHRDYLAHHRSVVFLDRAASSSAEG
jgi:putative restriction endonuclease